MKLLHMQIIDKNNPILIKPFAYTESFIKEWLIAFRVTRPKLRPANKTKMHKITKYFTDRRTKSSSHYNLTILQSSILKFTVKTEVTLDRGRKASLSSDLGSF